MVNSKCLGLLFVVFGSALAIKERIVFDPQIHKEAPGDDPDFTAVPEADPALSQLLSKQQQQARVNDVNGALDFLAGFAQFQQESKVAPRSDRQQQLSARLQALQEAEEEQEEEQPEAEQDDDQDDQDALANSYFQSLIGRISNEQKPVKPRQNNKMELPTTQSTTTVLTTKAPRAAALQQSQQSAALGVKAAGGIDYVMIALLTCLAVAAAVGVIVSVFCFVNQSENHLEEGGSQEDEHGGGLIASAFTLICCCCKNKIQKRSRSTQRFDYSGPGNGSGTTSGATGKKNTGSNDSLSGSAASAAASKLSAIFGGHSGTSNVDKKLANNATLYHFEHHKKEMMAAESADVPAEFGDSDAESGDENDENDYTVYECPGLAPTGEMQVDNPLFRIKQQASQPAASQATGAGSARVSPPVVVQGLQQSGSPK